MRGNPTAERRRFRVIDPAQHAFRLAGGAPARRSRRGDRRVEMPELLGQVQGIASRQDEGPDQARSLALLPQSWHRQSTSLRFVGLRGLRPILGLRPLRHTIGKRDDDPTRPTARPSELTHSAPNDGGSDDRSGSERRRGRLAATVREPRGCSRVGRRPLSSPSKSAVIFFSV
jgi:hypothetical protein